MKQDLEYQAKWLRLINKYKISNQTMKVFCLNHDVKVYQLQYWVNKYKTKPLDHLTGFTEVKVTKQPVIQNLIKITSRKLVIEIPDLRKPNRMD